MVNFYQLLESINNPTIGAGALVVSQETRRVLIGFRSNTVSSPNKWSTFGGLVNRPNEVPLEGAVRELMEETGYTEKILDKEFLYYYSGDKKRIPYYTYVFIVKNEFQPDLNEENSNYRWVTMDELLTISPKHYGLEEIVNRVPDKLKQMIEEAHLIFLKRINKKND